MTRPLLETLGGLLGPLGFDVVVDEIVGRRGTVAMTVSFDPRPTLPAVTRVNVTCESAEPGGDRRWLYTFDQARAALGHGRDYTGMSDQVVADFEQITVPFIRSATSCEAIVRMLLRGDIPPSFGIGPTIPGQVWSAYGIVTTGACDVGVDEVARAARERARDWTTVEHLRSWAEDQGVTLTLDDPPRDLRHSVDRWLPRRWRRYDFRLGREFSAW